MPAADDFDPANIELEDPWAEQPSASLRVAQRIEKSGESEFAADKAAPAIDEIPAACDRLEEVTLDQTIAAGRSEASAAVPEIPAAIAASLSSKALAVRLGVTLQALNRYRSRSDFSEWCRSKDPDDKAWQYNEASRQFNSATPETDNFAPAIQSIAAIDEATIGLTETVPAAAIDPEQILTSKHSTKEIESSLFAKDIESEPEVADAADHTINLTEANGSTGSASIKSKRLKNDRRSKNSKKRSRAS